MIATILITIYVLSVLGARQYVIKVYLPTAFNPNPDSVDVLVTLIPGVNSVFSVLWVLSDVGIINWYFNRKK